MPFTPPSALSYGPAVEEDIDPVTGLPRNSLAPNFFAPPPIVSVPQPSPTPAEYSQGLPGIFPELVAPPPPPQPPLRPLGRQGGYEVAPDPVMPDQPTVPRAYAPGYGDQVYTPSGQREMPPPAPLPYSSGDPTQPIDPGRPEATFENRGVSTADRDPLMAAWNTQGQRDNAGFPLAEYPVPQDTQNLGRKLPGMASPPLYDDPAAPLKDLARRVALETGIDPDIFGRLVQQESTWNPRIVSPAGAAGLTQLMPGTARGLGVTNVFDPEQNLRGGAKYLKQQLDRYGGDIRLALAAYNAGPGNVDKYGGVPPFAETQTYLKKILGDGSGGATFSAMALGGQRPLGQPPIPQGDPEPRPDVGPLLAPPTYPEAPPLLGRPASPVLSPEQQRAQGLLGQATPSQRGAYPGETLTDMLTGRRDEYRPPNPDDPLETFMNAIPALGGPTVAAGLGRKSAMVADFVSGALGGPGVVSARAAFEDAARAAARGATQFGEQLAGINPVNPMGARTTTLGMSMGVPPPSAGGAGPGKAPNDDPLTINTKTWYHGTGTADLTPESLDPLVTNHESLMGQGIYLTDNPDIAAGYARSRGRRTGTPTVYATQVNVGNVLDLESPVPVALFAPLERFARGLDFHGGYDYLTNEPYETIFRDTLAQEMAKPGVTTENVLQAFRREIDVLSNTERIPSNEFTENFGVLAEDMRRAGIDALTHTGGLRTGRSPHRVLIVLDPNDTASGVGRSGQVTSMTGEAVQPAAPPPPPAAKPAPAGASGLPAVKPGMVRMYRADIPAAERNAEAINAAGGNQWHVASPDLNYIRSWRDANAPTAGIYYVDVPTGGPDLPPPSAITQSQRAGMRLLEPPVSAGQVAAEKISGIRPPTPAPPEPPRPVPPPVPDLPGGDGTKERLFAQSVRTAPDTEAAVTDALAADPGSYYSPISNAVTADAAEKLIKKDMSAARSLVYDSNEVPDATTSAVAQMLIKSTQDDGDFEEAVRLTEAIAARATRAGQFIQAFSMYGRLRPESVGVWAQKTVKQAQEAGHRGAKLTPKKLEQLVRQSERIQELPEGRERELQSEELVRDVAELVPVSLWTKIATLQTMGQLLNPKTAIRNLSGNLIFAGFENATRLLSVGLDLPISLLTGQRSTAMTKNLAPVIGGLGSMRSGAREGLKEALRGVNTQGLAGQFDLPLRRVFGTTPVLSQMEKALAITLRVPDQAFFTAAFDDSLLSAAWVTAKNEGLSGTALGQRTKELVAFPTNDMLTLARGDALFRTFQDDNLITGLFTGIKKAFNLGQDFGLGDFILKYPRTPANLLVRAAQYSPIGFLESAAHLFRGTFNKGKNNQKGFVESVARATIGTAGLTVLGATLASAGLLTGRSSKDPDVRAQQTSLGMGQFRFNVTGTQRWIADGFSKESARNKMGDVWMSYDWLQPMAVSVALGAQAVSPEKKTLTIGPMSDGGVLAQVADQAATATEVTAVGIDTLAQQPLVQGVQRALGGENFATSMVNVLKSAPASFAPTLLSQMNQVMDNTLRDPYDPNVVGEAFNRVLAKVPILAATLPAAVDVWGGEKDRYHMDTNNPFNVFVNPAFVSQYFPKPETEMILGLQEATGQVSQFPRDVPSRITVTQGGKTADYILSPEQSREYQVLVGEMTREAFTNLANNREFQAGAPEEQVKFLGRVLTAVNTEAKELLREKYQEAQGGVTPLPPPEPKKPTGRESLTSKNVAEYYHAEKLFEPYDNLPEALKARTPAYREADAQHDRLTAAATTPAGQAALQRFEDKNPQWLSYQRGVDRERELMRGRNRELEMAGRRFRAWEPKAATGVGTAGGPPPPPVPPPPPPPPTAPPPPPPPASVLLGGRR